MYRNINTNLYQSLSVCCVLFLFLLLEIEFLYFKLLCLIVHWVRYAWLQPDTSADLLPSVIFYHYYFMYFPNAPGSSLIGCVFVINDSETETLQYVATENVSSLILVLVWGIIYNIFFSDCPANYIIAKIKQRQTSGSINLIKAREFTWASWLEVINRL